MTGPRKRGREEEREEKSEEEREEGSMAASAPPAGELMLPGQPSLIGCRSADTF